MKRYIKQYLKKLIDFVEQTRFWSIDPGNTGYLFRELQKRAADETVDFIYKNMEGVCWFDSQKELLEYSVNERGEGLLLEFGVYKGSTINIIAKVVNDSIVHGFDSFEGLPSQWAGLTYGKAPFNLNKKLPKVRQNVKLHAGWFEETVPPFFSSNNQKIGFMHIDCDLYTSTKTIFNYAKERIGTGTIILFDEFFNYPGWKLHEYKAFNELVDERKLSFEYLGFSNRQVAIRIL